LPGTGPENLEGGDGFPKEEKDQGVLSMASLVLDALRFMIEVLEALL
jgi:hypothetical protein